jgi:hypothetical protein
LQDLDRVVEAVSFEVQEAAMVCERPGADPLRLVEIEARIALGSKAS